MDTNEKVRISSLEIENVKRVQAVELTLDNGLFIIGGNNRQGKTSVLDAICAALGGESHVPSVPIHDGAKKGMVTVNLSNGISATRTFTAKGTYLKVSGREGGQTLLKQFISEFALDLGQFMRASDKEKAKTLLRIIGVDLVPLDERYAATYAKRTVVGQQEERQRKHAEAMPFDAEAPRELVTNQHLLQEFNDIAKHNANVDARERNLATVQGDEKRAEARLAGAQAARVSAGNAVAVAKKRFEDLRAEQSQVRTDGDTACRRIQLLAKDLCEVGVDILATIGAIETMTSSVRQLLDKNVRLYESLKQALATITTSEQELANAETTLTDSEQELQLCRNRVRSAELVGERVPTDSIQQRMAEVDAINVRVRRNQDREKALADADFLRAEYRALTDQIQQIEDERTALLESAHLPMAGLSVRENVLYFLGKPWDCMSGADQLIVATAICRAVNPRMGFVLVDKLEGMDLDSLAAYAGWLEREGLQAITTRVSKGGECSIIIEDGCIKE